MIYRRAALGLFAKMPRAGSVKTRLVPPLTAEEAAALARVCLEETLRRFPPAIAVPWTLFLEGEPEGWVERLASIGGVALADQGPGDLGHRLTRAFRALRAGGAERIVVIGSDSPTLDPAWIVSALELLESSDVVLGPARDGGYYLVGARVPADALFEGIPWGTDRVGAQTRIRSEEAGWSVASLPEWFDLDQPGDLIEAAESAVECPALASVLLPLLPRLRGVAPRR